MRHPARFPLFVATLILALTLAPAASAAKTTTTTTTIRKGPPVPKLAALVSVAGLPSDPVATKSYVYAASDSPSVLSVVSARTHHVATSVPIPPRSFAIVISPDLSTIYIASPNTLTTFSTHSNHVTSTKRLSGITALVATSNGDVAVLFGKGHALGVLNQAAVLTYHRTLKVPATYLAAASSILTLSFRSPANPIITSYTDTLVPQKTTATLRGATGLFASALGVFVPNVARKSLYEYTPSLALSNALQIKDPQLVTTRGNSVFVSSPSELYEFTRTTLVAHATLGAPLISLFFDGPKLYDTSYSPQASFGAFALPALQATSRLTLGLATGQASPVPGTNLVYVSNHADLLADIILN